MIEKARIRDAVWYSGSFPGCVGIILYDTGYGFKAYIGSAGGLDEAVDSLYIATNGTRFPTASAIWPDVKEWAD